MIIANFNIKVISIIFLLGIIFFLVIGLIDWAWKVTWGDDDESGCDVSDDPGHSDQPK